MKQMINDQFTCSACLLNFSPITQKYLCRFRGVPDICQSSTHMLFILFLFWSTSSSSKLSQARKCQHLFLFARYLYIGCQSLHSLLSRAQKTWEFASPEIPEQMKKAYRAHTLQMPDSCWVQFYVMLHGVFKDPTQAYDKVSCYQKSLNIVCFLSLLQSQFCTVLRDFPGILPKKHLSQGLLVNSVLNSQAFRV